MKIGPTQTDDKTAQKNEKPSKLDRLKTDEVLPGKSYFEKKDKPIKKAERASGLFKKARAAMDRILNQGPSYWESIIDTGRGQQRKAHESALAELKTSSSLDSQPPGASGSTVNLSHPLPRVGSAAFDNWVRYDVPYSPVKGSDTKRLQIAKRASAVGLRLNDMWDDKEFYSDKELETHVDAVERWNKMTSKRK